MSRRRATVRPSGSAPRTSRDWATTRTTSAAVVALARPTCQAPLPQLALQRTGRLEREPALADARRAGQRHEPMLAQESDHLGSSSSRSMNEVEAAGGLPRRGGRRDRRDRWVVRQNRLLHAAQLQGRARVPAPPGGPAWPPGTPRARPPGVRSDRAPASAAPTGARETGSPPAPRGSPQRRRRALPRRAPPRSAPPTRRAGARPAARPRPLPTTSGEDP